MIRRLISQYSWRYPATLVYMLQTTEYQAAPYLLWYWRTNSFDRVTYRRELVRTRAANMLLSALRIGMAVQVAAGLLLIGLWHWQDLTDGFWFGMGLVILYPVVWAHLVVVPLVLGRLFIVRPRQRRRISASKQTFSDFKGVKIAIAGSYGKTSMKEILFTVLSEGKNVAATPANKNVAISHAIFADSLTGDEDVLIIEYGEGAPDDVRRFAENTRPTHAVITGIAPAHLDKYKTVHAAGKDIFSVAKFVQPGAVYVNGESADAKPFIEPEYEVYTEDGVLGWKVSSVHVSLDGTSFTMSKNGKRLRLQSKLLGRHQVGPLVLAAALAHKLGLSDAQIRAGIAKTAPFEHRMQPYELNGAWVVDDTYNGNLEGIRVGTQLLRDLPGKRKIYVTPGLVDQGADSAKIHEEIGRLIAGAKPDIVVLMRHSVTPDIEKGSHEADYKGEVIVEDDPLNFYNNLQSFVAHGDIVVMQNDWPDNYR